jgi:hypothetical protein
MEDVAGVEVYDSPALYGGERAVADDDLIIGVPKAIRNALEISGRWDDPNSMVVIEHAGSRVTAKVVFSDTRLASDGDSAADDKNHHCWMTRAVRQRLGLAEISAVHRANCPSFARKFTPVTIKGSRLLFSYGSNGGKQLRGRIERGHQAALETRPASLIGYRRIFCMDSPNWGGGYSSVHPSAGGVTYGNVAELSADEFTRLDGFEGGYRREKLMVTLQRDSVVPAWTYIANKSKFVRAPPDAYLTAIHIMLREHFQDDIAIDQYRVGAGGNLEASSPYLIH